MRLAATPARVAAEDITATSLTEMFHAATAGGAQALARTEIGRLAAGAQANLVLVNLTNPWMRRGTRCARWSTQPQTERSTRCSLRAASQRGS
jgi:cytosine/adenosine deaminase-related metal-dependent hydrolase